jgi:N-acyl-D-amino-acid deacylase
VIETLIHGGRVIDGTGSSSFFGAVAIESGRLAIIRGNVNSVEAQTRIDATGHVVAPGFIDVHSHSGLMLLQNRHHEIKVRQGVTTELIGVDGNSYAPFRESEDLHQFVRMNAGLDGRPPIDYAWNTVAEYLSAFDRKVAINVAFLIGNSAVRICAVGWSDQQATGPQLADMQALLREGLNEGAFGLSSGLDYPPGSYASTDELVTLSQTVADLGGIYHTHVRYQLGDRFLDPFREAIEIGDRSGVPIHLTHLYRRSNAPGGSAEILDLVEAARARGLDTTFDTYPYEWNSTRLLILMPAWVQEGGPDAILERLADPALAPRIRSGLDQRGEQYGNQTWNHLRVGYFSKPENKEYEGRTIAEIAKLRQQTPADAICELLLSEDLRLNEVAASPDPWSLQKFVVHPLSMVGSDSIFIGDRPSPRTYGTFPRILGDLVRDERLMSLPEAVRKMTSYPAQRLGLPDRGLLRDGMAADVVVFDPVLVGSLATYDDPCRYPVGIRDVFVNGQPVLMAGEMTDALPGRSLRRRGSSS